MAFLFLTPEITTIWNSLQKPFFFLQQNFWRTVLLFMWPQVPMMVTYALDFKAPRLCTLSPTCDKVPRVPDFYCTHVFYIDLSVGIKICCKMIYWPISIFDHHIYVSEILTVKSFVRMFTCIKSYDDSTFTVSHCWLYMFYSTFMLLWIFRSEFSLGQIKRYQVYLF